MAQPVASGGVGFCAVGSFFLTFATQTSCPSSYKDGALGSPDPSQILGIPVFNNDLKARESCLFKRQLERIIFFKETVCNFFNEVLSLEGECIMQNFRVRSYTAVH